MQCFQHEHFIKIFYLFTALICFTALEGCGGGGITTPPNASYQLAFKAHEFMKIADLLFSQPPAYWGQGLRALYYSALTLARLKDTPAFYGKRERFHESVWKVSPIKIREYFGKALKEIRNKYDYGVEISHEEAVVDFKNFVQLGVEPFENLLDQAKKNICVDYKHCTSSPKSCKYCIQLNQFNCLKIEAVNELDKITSLLSGISRKKVGRN